MDLAVVGYLLFTIPGFCLVWTFRHFTKGAKIGDFEYAMWSFLWGTIMFLLSVYTSEEVGKIFFDLNHPLKLASTLMGMGLGLALVFSFPAGFFGAVLYSVGLFSWIDNKLFSIIKNLSMVKKIKKVN